MLSERVLEEAKRNESGEPTCATWSGARKEGGLFLRG